MLQIKVQQKDLLQVLNKGIKAVPNKASNPILENFSFRVTPNNELMVIATDTNLTISTAIPCEGEGIACLPATKLTELVRVLPDGEVTITTTETQAKIEWGNGHSELPVADEKLFPNCIFTGELNTAIAPNDLFNAFKHTLSCVGSDDLRPVLGGVFIDPTEDGFNFVASDSRVLMATPVVIANNSPIDKGFIVPASAVRSVIDAMGEEEVVIGFKDGIAAFGCGNTIVSTRVIVGAFPKYQQVFPTGNDSKLTISKGTILSALKRVSICASKATSHIKMNLDPLGAITLTAQDLGFGVAAKEELDNADYEGNDLAIGFKSDLLQKVIGAMDGEKVTLAFSTPTKAVLITSEDDRSKAIIMPIQIQ